MIDRPSIIICAYNHLLDLSVPCIKTARQNTQLPFELVLVDDGSEDRTWAFFGAVADKPVRLPRNSGPAAARNAGIKQATGSFLVFLDNDILVPAGWLRILSEDLQSSRAAILGGIPSDEAWKLHALPRSPAGLGNSRRAAGHHPRSSGRRALRRDE